MNERQPRPDRRGFLKGAALGAGAAIASGTAISAPAAAAVEAKKPTPADAARIGAVEDANSAANAAAITELGGADGIVSPWLVKDPGSDFMVDCLRSLGIEYVALNPGGSTTGLHESLINYGGNKNPEIITVTHEEIGAAMAHGYYKATGKPMAMLYYGVVGLQHASMALFNAYADQVPMIILAGDKLEATHRAANPDWDHAAIDLGSLVSVSIKWFDSPTSLQALAESLSRAYRIAMTEPRGPVLISIDADLQLDPCKPARAELQIPTYHPPVQPVANPAALADAARMLLAADYPVIVADRAVETDAGMANMVKLAELLGAPVLNKANRLCMPNRHPLNLTGHDGAVEGRADAFLCLGVDDVWSVLNSQSALTLAYHRTAKANAKVVTISVNDYAASSNTQQLKRFYSPDMPIVGSPEASLPYLIAAVQQAMTPEARAKADARAAVVAKEHAGMLPLARTEAGYAWDASPVAVARLVSELGAALKDEDWTLVSPQSLLGPWPQRLWNMDRHYRHLGVHGAAAMGYSAPASVGAAMGSAKLGRLPVAIITDGEMMYQPGVFWTAAHHKIPLLAVMHNNQGYHAEHMNVQGVANRRSRGIRNTYIGTTLISPEINFAGLVQNLGVWTAGPISDPNQLRPAIDRALQVVKSGLPALIDCRTQPR